MLQGATCFSHERERQRLELLLATGHRGHDLVRGTYLALLASVYPYLLGLAIVIVFGALVSAPSRNFPENVSGWAIVWLVLYLNFLLVLGMRISLRCRTNLRAVAWLFLVVGVLTLGPFVATGVSEFVLSADVIRQMAYATGDSYSSAWHDPLESLCCLSPLTLLATGIEGETWRELWGKYPVAITVNVAFYVAATVLLYLRMATRFGRCASGSVLISSKMPRG